MSKYKKNYDDGYEEPDTDDFNNDSEEEDYSYDNQNQGNSENIKDKASIDVLVDTKGHLKALDKQFRGFVERDNQWDKTSEELARDLFIDKMVGGLRSIINPLNLYTYKSEEEVEKILLEKNEEFIKASLDEETVSEEDIWTMVNIYDHALETFMGHIAKGHGSLVLRDFYAGMSQGTPIERKKDKFLDGVGSWFNFGTGK